MGEPNLSEEHETLSHGNDLTAEKVRQTFVGDGITIVKTPIMPTTLEEQRQELLFGGRRFEAWQEKDIDCRCFTYSDFILFLMKIIYMIISQQQWFRPTWATCMESLVCGCG